jgi:vitamin B12 transporter
MERGFPLKTFLIIFLPLLPLISLYHPAFAASDVDMQTLEMYYDEKDIAVAATRAPQDISKVAENLTIINAREIEAINAHSLADVLRIVPGLQVNIRGGAGSIADASINGSPFWQFLVVIDGMQLNNFSDSSVNIGAFPVQNIKRVEIIKGPASSSWGPAMGGVINIVTKEPNEDARTSGTIYSSFGERGTGDYRGELTGTLGSLGYYINGSKLRTDGLLPHNGVDENNIYAKLNWDLPGKGVVAFTLGYNESTMEAGLFTDSVNDPPQVIDFSPLFEIKELFSTLTMNYALSDSLDLELSGRLRTQDASRVDNSETGFGKMSGNEESLGTSVKLLWRQRRHSMVIGADFDHGRTSIDYIDAAQSLSRTIDKWGLFINDTLNLGPVSLTPGCRYDWTNYKGDDISASLGITWQLTEHTLLRGYVGKGYGIPSAIFNFAKEHVMAYQVGFETADIPFLLLKTTLFMHRTTDSVSMMGDHEKLLKQGVEVEVRTLPLHNTSLFAGYNFVDASNRESGAEVPDIASHTCNLGLYYDDRRSFHGALTGHYIWWNSSNEVNILPGKYSAFIWDINLNKKMFTIDDYSAEVFFTGHNIFNGSQYQDGAFPNPRRWFEGGIRFQF